MKKLIIVLILILLAFVIGILLGRGIFTARVVEDINSSYSWTKAICNAEHECLDVSITCENGKALKIEPVSGFIEHNSSWEDPRGELAGKIC